MKCIFAAVSIGTIILHKVICSQLTWSSNHSRCSSCDRTAQQSSASPSTSMPKTPGDRKSGLRGETHEQFNFLCTVFWNCFRMPGPAWDVCSYLRGPRSSTGLLSMVLSVFLFGGSSVRSKDCRSLKRRQKHEHVRNRMVRLRDLTAAFITSHCRCEYPVFPSTVVSVSTQPCEKSHLHLSTQQQDNYRGFIYKDIMKRTPWTSPNKYLALTPNSSCSLHF